MAKIPLEAPVQESIGTQKAWRKVEKEWFKESPEIYYYATPYLKLIREKREWSLRDMAKRANISVNYYHDFERGIKRAKVGFVNKIRNAINNSRGTR